MRRQSCKGSDADVTGNCVHFSCVACASDDWIFIFPLNGWLETRFEETLEAHVALWAR